MKQRRKSFFLIVAFALVSVTLLAQTRTVSGVVTDQRSEPLVGVTVKAKGANAATMTDADGRYSLNVPQNVTALEVTYIGYKTDEQRISGTTVNFTLQEDATSLDEVVAIGYQTVRRKDLTGAVSSVAGEALKKIPTSSVQEALTGQLAGVQVTTSEGSPDAQISIRVRGGGSITQSNEPLYVVDGFPVSDISSIAPSDIETIDVLKDASSAAIYGARGANGVIIITTKSAKAGKIQVNYNGYYGISKIANPLKRLDVQDYLKWQYELSLLRGSKSAYEKYFGAYQDMDMYANYKGIDWLDQLYGNTGETLNHNVSVSGGSETINFTASYAHVNNDAIMKNSSYNRDNLSLKLGIQSSKSTKIDLSARYANTNILGAGSTDGSRTAVGMRDSRTKLAMLYSPIPFKVVNLDDAEDDMNDNLIDPFVSLRDNDRKQRREALNLAGGFSWQIFENFTVRTEAGLDRYNSKDTRFYGPTSYNSRNTANGTQGMPIITVANAWRNIFRNTNTINYDFKALLPETHSLNLIAGEETITGNSESLANIATDYPVEFTFEDCINLTGQGKAQPFDNKFGATDKLISYFGRINYGYHDRYLLSASFRADGSSKFAREHRWGYFPSVSAAWRISEESFMEGIKDAVSNLKIRASFGKAGNNEIPSGTMFQDYNRTTSNTGWLYNDNIWAPNQEIMANPKLTWETTTTRNVGLDFGLIKNRLYGTFDFYWNTTDNLLIRYPVTGSGYKFQYMNVGQTENKGFEATVNWIALDKKNYGLNLSFNIGFNKNKVNSLGGLDQITTQSYWNSEVLDDYIVKVGGQIGEMQGYLSDGRYEVDDFAGYDESTEKWILKDGQPTYSDILDANIRPGSIKLQDKDGDGKITAADKRVIGNANPVHVGGFSINGRLYGFDLTAMFNWSYGNQVYNANKIEYTSSSKYNYRNMIDMMAAGNRWTNLRPDGTLSTDLNELREMNKNTTLWSPYMKNFILTDWAVEDASFLRLNTLTLGYSLPDDVVRSVKLQQVRFYISAYNVFCLTKYTGFDPEVSTRSSSSDMPTPGVDYAAYPKSRQFLFGVNLTF
ncbi:MAG: TonB-dependent receptor [Prevotellaceae bacterium]|jgi:TonB-linked SusC/RagA family outer membrane protein|nr:TonB-dependent receptor [Prevotellaceae bacterium]